MGLAGTIARRSLVHRPGRTFFSVLGVAVGIATVVGVFTLDYNTMLARGGPSEDWSADLEVRPRQGLEGSSDELTDLPGVAGATAYFQKVAQFVAMVKGGGPENRVNAKLFAIEQESVRDLGAYVLGSGDHLSFDASKREILVGHALATRFQLQIGDEVRLAKPARAARRICKDGVWTEEEQTAELSLGLPFFVTGILQPERLGRQALGEVVVVPYELGLELYRGTPIESRFWVRKDPEVNLERLQAGLGQDYSYDMDKKILVGQSAEERAFRNGVQVAGLLAMVLGLYVIFHTLSVSIVERIREVGVLHALGTSRRQVAGVFFVEATIISFLAGAIGLGGGIAMSKAMLMLGMTTVGFDRHKATHYFEVPWAQVAALVSVGVGIALLGSVYPLMKARRTDTVSALRGDDLSHQQGVTRGFHIFAALLLLGILPALYFFIVPVVGEKDEGLVSVIMLGVGIMALFLLVPLVVPGVVGFACRLVLRPFEELWPLSGKLAARSVEQSPTRIGASVAAIALVTAAFVGLKGMTNSLRAEVEVWADEAVLDKVWVRNLPNVPFEELKAHLGQYPGIRAIESGDVKDYMPFRVLGMKETELASYGPCADDPTLIEKLALGQGMIISERLARQRKYEIGDEIHLKTVGHGVQSFPVVAISDAYGYFPHPDERLYGVVSDRHMARYYCMDTKTVTSVAVRLDRDIDSDVVVAAIGAMLPQDAEPPNYQTGAEVLKLHVDDISRDFRLFDVILGLTALLACIGVLNGQLLAALERAKELGVLRALGMSRGQIAGTVLLECVVVGATGGLLGLGLGAALTPVIVTAIEVLSALPLPLRSAGLFLALVPLGALAVTAMSGLYPIWRMNRLDAVSAVRAG